MKIAYGFAVDAYFVSFRGGKHLRNDCLLLNHRNANQPLPSIVAMDTNDSKPALDRFTIPTMSYTSRKIPSLTSLLV